jgi:VanZ family protein
MGLIFSASSDSASFSRSSRIVGPIVRWLFPQLSDAAVHATVIFARKCAHLTEYGILALLIWRALRQPRQEGPRPWRWSEAGRALAITAIYAASDEFHQLFVVSRQASFRDVLLDTVGGGLALGFCWAASRLRNRWR